MLPTTSYKRDPSWMSTPSSMVENKPDVCTDHLGGVCRHGMSCMKYHARESYQWQKQDPTGNSWLDMIFEENCKVEKSYCNPAEEHCNAADMFTRSVYAGYITVLFIWQFTPNLGAEYNYKIGQRKDELHAYYCW